MTWADELLGQEDEGPEVVGTGTPRHRKAAQHSAGFGPDVTMTFQAVPDARSTPGIREWQRRKPTDEEMLIKMDGGIFFLGLLKKLLISLSLEAPVVQANQLRDGTLSRTSQGRFWKLFREVTWSQPL